MPKRFLITAIVLVAVVSALAIPKTYILRQSSGGTLYWNADQALLFVEVGSSGARLSWLRYAAEPFLVSIGDVRPPDNNRCSQIIVIRITDKDVQRFDTGLQRNVTDSYCFGNYVLFQGQIYAGYMAKHKAWKWSGTQFEPATEKDLVGFDPLKFADRGFQFDNVDGWSMREYALGRVTYSLTLNGKPMTYVSSGRMWPAIHDVSVDLIRPGQPQQRIWSLDGQPHPISKAEYEQLFDAR